MWISCEVDSDWIAVDAVKAALRYKASGEQHLVLVGWDRRVGVVGVPGVDQRVAELAARLDEERARPHRRVADLEVEDQRRRGVGAQAFESRRQGLPHDRLGERPRRVVAAGASPFIGWLEDRRANRRRRMVGTAARVDDIR